MLAGEKQMAPIGLVRGTVDTSMGTMRNAITALSLEPATYDRVTYPRRTNDRFVAAQMQFDVAWEEGNTSIPAAADPRQAA